MEYFGGVTIQYQNEEIYINCRIYNDRRTIKKIEFGKLNDGWVKGVFVNNKKLYLTFLQDSFDGEDGEKYRLDYSLSNKQILYNFLQIPSERGWTEIEYRLDNDKFYKVVVELSNKLYWKISLIEPAKQSLPLLGDKLDAWFNMKICDAFWNESRRKKTESTVNPMVRIEKED